MRSEEETRDKDSIWTDSPNFNISEVYSADNIAKCLARAAIDFKLCPNCFTRNKDYNHCPNCGHKFEQKGAEDER